MPVWSSNRSSDLILNFTTADAAARQQESAPITFRGKPLQSVSLRKGYFYGNLAVVRFGSQYITAVRKIQFYLTPRTSVADYPLEKDPKKKWISWWTNKISLCTSDPLTLQPQSCTDFEPRNWTDCLWNGGFETLGPEDPRLIIWPSKGLFMMFNSKPWPVNPAGTTPDDTRCAGPWAQQPWLVPVATFTRNSLAACTNSFQPQRQGPSNTITSSRGSSSSTASSQQQQKDPWTQGLIRLRYLPPELQQNPQEALLRIQKQQGLTGPLLHKEKNWNPFIYKNELYFSQSFVPHIVIKPTADGTCRMVHLTDGLAFSQLPSKPRGNTQAVLLPAAVSGLNKAVYLGIVHTEVERSYTNYLYQMEAEPPFAITAVSAPLPMVPGKHPRVPAWDHISFPMSLQLLEDSNQLMIGYGSGDQVPRVRFLLLEEALALFDATSRSGSGGSSNQQQATVVAAGAADASAATDPGLAAKLASKLAGYSPRAQAAAQEAVAAVEAAMGLQSTAATAPTG